MGELLVVGVAAVSARGEDLNDDERMDETLSFLAVSVVSLENKTIEWHLLSSQASGESVVTHVRVLLDDMQWRHERPQLGEVSISACGPFAETIVAAAAKWRGCSGRVVARQELTTDERELAEESLRLLLRSSSVAAWNATQKAVEPSCFEACVDILYATLVEDGKVIGNPRFEKAFRLSVEEYSTPLRPYLR